MSASKSAKLARMFSISRPSELVVSMPPWWSARKPTPLAARRSNRVPIARRLTPDHAQGAPDAHKSDQMRIQLDGPPLLAFSHHLLSLGRPSATRARRTVGPSDEATHAEPANALASAATR